MPIWVTEWNLQMSKTTGNTLLQSLFTAQYLLEVLSNPKFSSVKLTTYHNLGGRDLSGSIFRNNNGRMDIQSTYFPMRMISKIFESNIVKINKDQTEEVYTYSCYDKNNKEVLRYILDWQSHDFTCVSTFSQDTIVHKSLNLFDKADNLGKF